MKKLSIYWLTIEPDEIHKRKVALLEDSGFEVTFFKTLDSLTKELHTRRASIIIVGDEGPEVIVVKAISLLRRMPDIQGARLILSTSRHSPVVLRAAACEGFRDLLPIQMADPEWLSRFMFSTAGVPAEMPRVSDYSTSKFDTTLAIPARIVWMSPKRLWIESRFFPPAGTRIAISGPMAQAMGCKYLDLEIEELHENNLIYRFSEALVGRWSVPDRENPKVSEALHVLKDLDVGERYKVFLAIQSPALRATLLRYLSHAKFEVHTALQKRSMIDEPKYFTPDLVFVEDRLCRGESLDRFRAMISNLPETTSIVVVGSDKEVSTIRANIGRRRLFFLKRIPLNLDQMVFNEFLGPNYQKATLADKDAAFIPYDHEFSLAELNISARVEALHPDGAIISVPHEIGNYGLTRIKSPALEKLLGRNPYAKITGLTYGDDGTESAMPFQLECQFCDITAEQRDLLAKNMDHLANDTVWDEREVTKTTSAPSEEPAAEPKESTATNTETHNTSSLPPDTVTSVKIQSIVEPQETEMEPTAARRWPWYGLLVLVLVLLVALAGWMTQRFLFSTHQESVGAKSAAFDEF